MPPHCCVPKCTSSKRKKSCRGQTFHRFPKDPELRREWIHKIRRDPGRHFKIHVDTKVCSEHFTEESFLKTLVGMRKLKKGVVPTLFAWTDNTVRPVGRAIVRGTTSYEATAIGEEDVLQVDVNCNELSRVLSGVDMADQETGPYGLGKRAAAGAAVFRVREAAMAILQTESSGNLKVQKRIIPSAPFIVPEPYKRPPTLLLSPSYSGNPVGGFVCEVCGQNFFSFPQMVRHKQFHDEERPFPCGVCGKRFLSRSHYTEHQRVHTGERPFPCDQCERSFTTHHNLKRHQTIHAKEEVYRCRKCGVLFCQRHEYPRGIPRPDLEPRPGFESMSTMQPTPPIQVTLTPKQLKKLNKKSHDLSNKHDHSEKKKKRSRVKHPGLMEKVHSVGQEELWPEELTRGDKLQKVAYDIEVII